MAKSHVPTSFVLDLFRYGSMPLHEFFDLVKTASAALALVVSCVAGLGVLTSLCRPNGVFLSFQLCAVVSARLVVGSCGERKSVWQLNVRVGVATWEATDQGGARAVQPWIITGAVQAPNPILFPRADHLEVFHFPGAQHNAVVTEPLVPWEVGLAQFWVVLARAMR